MFDFIFVFLEVVWPRLGFCLLFALGTPFVVVIFDLPWWAKLLIGISIFMAWLTLGIVLEVAHALGERRKEKEKEAKTDLKR
jgi:hypothetical protein